MRLLHQHSQLLSLGPDFPMFAVLLVIVGKVVVSR